MSNDAQARYRATGKHTIVDARYRASAKGQRAILARKLRRYGISVEQYEEMFQRQGGVCALCDEPPKKKRLCVDHDHETGRVRGLLCDPCNYALHHRIGKRWIDRAIVYLTGGLDDDTGRLAASGTGAGSDSGGDGSPPDVPAHV